MKRAFKAGMTVEWNWMGRKVKGDIKKIYIKPVTKILRGHSYTRNGSLEKPAYLIESLAGNEVLKSITEIKLARKA